MQRDLVERERWISLQEYKEGLALSQLPRGPLAAQLAIYLGWTRFGVLGATLVAFAFILPSLLMVLGLSALYLQFGGLPWMQGVFCGVGASVIHQRAVACWRWVDAATLFMFTLPGTVIGIGLITLWNRPFTNWIYATPAILVSGYVAQYAALSTRTILAGFAQTSPGLEEAAEVAGAGWFRRVFGILAPLVRPAILVCWTVTFLFCLRDVSLPLLLAPPGHDTLTARTMTLMANGSAELVAAFCLLSMSLTAVPLVVYAAARRIPSKTA